MSPFFFYLISFVTTVDLTHLMVGHLQVQEYVEAATFCNFCKSGTLLNLDEINATLLPLSDPSLEPLQINVLDYLLGVCPLSHVCVSMCLFFFNGMRDKICSMSSFERIDVLQSDINSPVLHRFASIPYPSFI